MRTYRDICYTQTGHPSQVLDLYLPEQESFPVFVYFHGGGLENGDKLGSAGVPQFIQALVAQGVAVASANYRMYPEAVFPEYLRDAACAVAWVRRNIGDYGTCTGLYVGGSSAGGYITQMLCFDKKYLAPHFIDADNIDGYVMDAGQPTAHFNILREKGIDSRRVVVDETAPLYHVCENPNYAPMLILVSDDDMPSRYEQTMLLFSTLKDMNGPSEKFSLRVIENSTHCSYLSKDTPVENNLFARLISSFIREHPAK